MSTEPSCICSPALLCFKWSLTFAKGWLYPISALWLFLTEKQASTFSPKEENFSFLLSSLRFHVHHAHRPLPPTQQQFPDQFLKLIYRESVNLRQAHPNEHGCVNELLIFFFSLFYLKPCVHLYTFGHLPQYQNYSGFLWVVSLISEQFLNVLWLTVNTDCMMQMTCRTWCIQNIWCFNNTDSYNKVNFVLFMIYL